jgi:hypothetical protein
MKSSSQLPLASAQKFLWTEVRLNHVFLIFRQLKLTAIECPDRIAVKLVITAEADGN